MRRRRSASAGNGVSDSARNNAQNNPDSSEDVWSRPNWPPLQEKLFVELLMEEMKIHVDVCATGFTEEVWDHVCEEFNEETNLNYDKTELKKHLAVLKKRYRIVKQLYDHGGFGWDYCRKMVDVDDSVWQEYIQVYPEIKPYRKCGCPIYDELCTIFTKPTATGQYAIAIGGGKITRMDMSSSSSAPNKRPKVVPQHENSDVGSESRYVAEPNKHSFSECISLLNAMQGVDRRLYNGAIELLRVVDWRQVFVSINSERRVAWLRAMLPGA